MVSGAEQAAAAEAGAGGELLGAFNVATFAGEVRCLRLTDVRQKQLPNRQNGHDAAPACQNNLIPAVKRPFNVSRRGQLCWAQLTWPPSEVLMRKLRAAGG